MGNVLIGKNRKTHIVRELTGFEQLEYTLEENARLTLVVFVLKRTNVNSGIRVNLSKSGAHADIRAIVYADADSQIYLATKQYHAAADTMSNLLVKSVLGGTSGFYFDGSITVTKNAQKTDAYQRNENLMLSEGAHAESKPTLEILANDVRCTHAATTGQIPQDQLWYMGSRGLRKSDGERLIVRGFLEGALDILSDEKEKKALRDRIGNTL